MRRAVLLPTPGSNPFLIQTWLRNFDFWRRPDDALYVFLSWPQSAVAYKAISEMVLERGGYVIYRHGEWLDHGLALDALIPMIRDDHEITLFMEDDLYVRHPHALEEITRKVESNEAGVVGVRRWNGSVELQTQMGVRNTSGLWPHLLVARTDAVKAVREHWGAHIWQPGAVIKPLWWRTPKMITSDTAIAATLELRRGRTLHEILSPNVERASTDDDWFHVGSLSTGPLPHSYPGSGGDTPLKSAVHDPHSWAQRVAWWERTLKRSVPGMDKLYEEHTRALRALRVACGRARVERWARKYDALVTWNE